MTEVHEHAAPREKQEITKTTRDLNDLRVRLQSWFADRLPAGAEPEITDLTVPASTGMSSLTVLLDVRFREDGGTRTDRFVVRVAPEATAVPVFPRYDLEEQFRVMQAVGAHTTVPLPPLHWSETDPAYLGAPFLVMGRVDGDVPPDNLPYNFGSWLTEATPAQRARMQETTIDVLADIHRLADPEQTLGFLETETGPTALRRHVAGQRAYYAWTIAADGVRVPLLERSFEWLEEHWPAEEGAPVLSWGDARIGNVMYRDFEPVAVLDWEMAALAPREVDVAWFIFLHRFFEDLAATYGFPGLPDFLRREDVVARYEAASGHTLRDLDFYLTYAAIRHGIVMSQTQRRAIHFGEAEAPDDVDDLISHRATLEKLLAGRYEWRQKESQ